MTASIRAGGWDAVLTERDRAILDDLARVRLLTGRHVQRLHFDDGSPLTQARRTRSVLQRLTNHGLLHRFERRIGGVHAGSSGHLYGLGAKGQRLVGTTGPSGGRRRRRPWEGSTMFFDHMLAVSEIYVRLREAERLGQLELLQFDAEPAAWRRWNDETGSQLILKPDAFVFTAKADLAFPTFVEVDRATESRTVIRRKAETYVAYWLTGIEQAKGEVFPRVCWVVPNEHRLEQIVDALGRLSPDAWQLFQVTELEHATDHLVGEPP